MEENKENIPNNLPQIKSQEQMEYEAAEKFARANPNSLPPQFGGDPEKFLKSFKEMRATLTKTQQELAEYKKPKEANVTTETQPPKETSVPPTDILKIPDAPAPTKESPTEADWNSWGNELRQSGDIGEETRKKIKERFGIPDSIINDYVAGAKAKSAQAVQMAAQLVGGNDNLKRIIEWSQSNLTNAERALVNDQLSSANWQTTLLGLAARMQKSQPDPTANEPKTKVTGKVNSIPADIEAFTTRAEMTMHIRDPRYGKDMKYTDWVQKRIVKSGTTKW